MAFSKGIYSPTKSGSRALELLRKIYCKNNPTIQALAANPQKSADAVLHAVMA